MKEKTLALVVIGLIAFGAMVFGTPSPAGADRVYDVTITNITRGQVFSPPVIISHNSGYSLFTLGAPASAQLYPLAEDGMTDPLTNHLDTLSSVYDYSVAEGPVPPGESVTLQIRTSGPFRLLSAVGMLVTTNDAFFAMRGTHAPAWGLRTVTTEAYDAGSERNSEDCDFIPGPPCENPGQRNTADAEEYVHVHAGIQGVGDLAPENTDWRNPVAIIGIQRVLP